MVLRKLAQALSGLSVRLYAHWPSWLVETLSRVGAGNGTPEGRAGREGVLQVLQIAMEEVDRAELPNNLRLAYLATVTDAVPFLVNTLQSSLSATDVSPAEANAALDCFGSLLLAGQLNHANLETLYPLLLPFLTNEQTVTAACSAVSEIVERSSGVSGGLGVTKFVNRQRCYELVRHWCCTEFVQQAVRSAAEEGEPDEETRDVMRLVCTVGELFVEFLFEPMPAAARQVAGAIELTLSSPETATFFYLLLAMSGFPGHSVEALGVNLLPDMCWMTLQESCSDVGLVFGSGQGREGRTGWEEHWPIVKAVWEALAETQRSRTTYPPRSETRTWPKGERPRVPRVALPAS